MRIGAMFKMKGCSNGRSEELTMECPVQGLLEERQIACPHVQPFIEPDLQGKENDHV